MTRFTDRQIEAAGVNMTLKMMPGVPLALAREIVTQPGPNIHRVRETIVKRLEVRELALKLAGSVPPDRLTGKAGEVIAGFKAEQQADDDYLRNTYGSLSEPSYGQPREGQPTPGPEPSPVEPTDETQARADNMLRRGMELMRQMDNEGNLPSPEQMTAFVKDFLALPGQKDDLIDAFFHTQRALQTTGETVERAKRELRAAQEQHKQAEARFIQTEEFLRQTLTWAGEEVPGDEATRVLTGSKMQIRATKGEEGILYAVLEKVG